MSINNKRNDARREQILDAARSLFIRQGFAKTSVDDISSSIGMTKSSLYYYFKNKEDLFYSSFQNEWKENLNKYIELAEKETEPEKQIMTYVDASLGYYEETVLRSRVPVRVVMEQRTKFHELIEEVNTDRIQFFASRIEKGIEEGRFRENIDPVRIAEIIWKVKYSMQFDMLNNQAGREPDKDDFVQIRADISLAISLLLDGIKK